MNILLENPCPDTQKTFVNAGNTLGVQIKTTYNRIQTLAIVKAENIQAMIICRDAESQATPDANTTLKRIVSCPVLILSTDNAPLLNNENNSITLGVDGILPNSMDANFIVTALRAYLTSTQKQNAPNVTKLVSSFPKEGDYNFDNFLLNPAQFRLHTQNGRAIKLPLTEFLLLEWFVRHPRHTFRRYELCEMLKTHGFTPSEPAINTKVLRLRKKMKPHANNPAFIRTVHGVGYICDTDVELCNVKPLSEKREG
tara:strand:+ start:350 stop:1114 length:765 start_codon:yes stop_codon:yes gene_type:complete